MLIPRSAKYLSDAFCCLANKTCPFAEKQVLTQIFECILFSLCSASSSNNHLVKHQNRQLWQTIPRTQQQQTPLASISILKPVWCSVLVCKQLVKHVIWQRRSRLSLSLGPTVSSQLSHRNNIIRATEKGGERSPRRRFSNSCRPNKRAALGLSFVHRHLLPQPKRTSKNYYYIIRAACSTTSLFSSTN